MASEAQTKADAEAEKAYAEAAEQVSPKSPVEADAVKAPAPAKGERPVAAPVAAKAKSAPKKKQAAAKKAPAPRAKAKPVRKAPAKAKSAAAKAAPAQAAKPTISELKDKIMATAQKTEKTATDFTKTVKDAAADVQTRAKAAYDKAQAYAGEMTEFHKGNFEAFVESGKILTTGVQDLARGEVEAAKGAFETATADLKALAAVKSPTELFKLQGEIARRNFDAAVARLSQNAEVSMKLAGDAFAPLSSRVSLAAEKISKAA